MIVPDAVSKRAHAIGRIGVDWLAKLDAIGIALSQRWQITVGQPFNGGTESVVLPATLQDGSQAIVKIGLPSVCDTSIEAHILNLAQGNRVCKVPQPRRRAKHHYARTSRRTTRQPKFVYRCSA